MGLAQCRTHERRLAGALVAAFVCVLVYSETPWASILHDWLPAFAAVAATGGQDPRGARRGRNEADPYLCVYETKGQ